MPPAPSRLWISYCASFFPIILVRAILGSGILAVNAASTNRAQPLAWRWHTGLAADRLHVCPWASAEKVFDFEDDVWECERGDQISAVKRELDLVILTGWIAANKKHI